MSRLVPLFVLLVTCSGRASAIYKGGRFHNVLHTGADRSHFQAALGEPTSSGHDPGFNNLSYDDFLISGPVYNSSLATGASTLFGARQPAPPVDAPVWICDFNTA